MRRTFQKWLLLFMATAFGLTFFLSYTILTWLAVEDADSTITSRLTDSVRSISDSNAVLQAITDDINDQVASKSTSAVSMLDLLTDDEYKLVLTLKLDESVIWQSLYSEAYINKEAGTVDPYHITYTTIDDPLNEFVSGDISLPDGSTVTKTKLEKEEFFTDHCPIVQTMIYNVDNMMSALGIDAMHLISGVPFDNAKSDRTGKGYIVCSNTPGYIGYDMWQRNETESLKNYQSIEFMEDVLFTNEKSYVQSIQQDTSGDYWIYGGSTNLNSRGRRTDPECIQLGVLQIGYEPKRLTDILNTADINNVAKTFRIAEDGGIIICSDVVDESGNSTYVIRGISNGADNTDRSYLIGQTIDDAFGISSSSFDRRITHFDGYDDKSKLRLSWTRSPNDPDLTVDTDYLVIGMIRYSEIYSSRNTSLVALSSANLLLFMVVFILISVLVDRSIVKKIYLVNDSLDKITQGDYDEKVNVTTNNEFTDLSIGINTMVNALKVSIEKEKNRLKKDLVMAKQIQFSVLPSVFPPYPERKEFDIYANMVTAKEVGGDFYDFFFIDGERLAFLVADVSGKGIPAALFMMRAKALVKGFAETRRMSPAEIVTEANNVLCDGNEAGMFVTMFFCLVNVKTGLLTYVNAGHNPPLLRHNGKYEYLKPIGGFVLAGLDGFKYKQADIQLVPGDLLYLYTDGVTEAANKSEELYGEPRLLDLLNSMAKSNVEEIIHAVNEDIIVFADGAEQADDITQIALAYNGLEDGKKEEAGTTFDATIDNLTPFLDRIESFAKERCSENTLSNLLICAEEIYVNIVHYAYGDKGGKVKIEGWPDGESIFIRFTDWGPKYDPLAKADPDITLSASERSIGGLGIFMVKKLMDKVEYEYKDGTNILTIESRLNK